MLVVCISRASFLFRSWRMKLHEAGIVDIILSFNNDCDRQQYQSDFQVVCYDRLFLFGRKVCFDLVWEWRDARDWSECLVTWICTC